LRKKVDLSSEHRTPGNHVDWALVEKGFGKNAVEREFSGNPANPI